MAIKNPRLVAVVTVEDLEIVEKASSLSRLRRGDYIRLVTLRQALKDLKEGTA